MHTANFDTWSFFSRSLQWRQCLDRLWTLRAGSLVTYVLLAGCGSATCLYRTSRQEHKNIQQPLRSPTCTSVYCTRDQARTSPSDSESGLPEAQVLQLAVADPVHGTPLVCADSGTCFRLKCTVRIDCSRVGSGQWQLNSSNEKSEDG